MNRPLKKIKRVYNRDILPEVIGKSNVASIERRNKNYLESNFVGDCIVFCNSAIDILRRFKTLIKYILPLYFLAILSIYASIDVSKVVSAAFFLIATILSAPLIISLVAIANIDLKLKSIDIFKGQLNQIMTGSISSTDSRGILNVIEFELNKEEFDKNFNYASPISYEDSKKIRFDVLSTAMVVSNAIYMIFVCIIAITRILV